MNNSSKDLTYFFSTAIQMEEKGQKFYEKQSSSAQNPLGKKTFEALARDEIDHINAIKSYYENLDNTGNSISVESILKKIPKQRAVNEIFQHPVKELNMRIDEVSTDDKEAYKFAMEFENDGFNFYKRYWKETQNADIKKLLEFLMNEEKSHYNLLQSTYLYLNEPAEWFNLQEPTMFEGG